MDNNYWSSSENNANNAWNQNFNNGNQNNNNKNNTNYVRPVRGFQRDLVMTASGFALFTCKVICKESKALQFGWRSLG